MIKNIFKLISLDFIFLSLAQTNQRTILINA